jgi:sugar porter (SP) family MFS transporter
MVAGSGGLNAIVVCTSLLASLGGFLFGYDIGYIGPIEGFPGFQQSVNGNQPLTSTEKGFITAVFSLGAVVASFPLVSSHICDGFGRRRAIIVGTVLFGMGAATQAMANDMLQLLLGRFISGLAVGSLSSVVPMYQSEVAPQEWRGVLGATYQWCITLGILVSYWVDAVVNPNDGLGWRLAIWFQLVPSLVLFFGMMAAPFSPRWLMLCGRVQEASETLQRLRGCSTAAAMELREIADSLKTVDGASNLGEICRDCYSRRLVLVGVAVMLLQQLCGMNAFMYYGVIIFEGLQLSPTMFNPIMGTVNVVATIPGLLLVDKVGRVKLLLWSSIAMLLACLCCAAALAQFPEECMTGGGCGPDAVHIHPYAVHAFVFGMFLFISAFACGWGPVAWVYCAEMFPLQMRSLALGVTTCSCWIGNYLIAHFTPVLLEMLHFWTFIIFAFFCGLGVMLSLWLPETQGVSLEDMPKLFGTKLGAKFDEDAIRCTEILPNAPPRYSSTA